MRDEDVREGSEIGHELPERGGVARIARDMEGIFGTATTDRPAKRRPGADPVASIVAPHPRRRPKPATGAPILLALGAFIGGGLAWLAFPSPHVAPAALRRPAPVLLAQEGEASRATPFAPPQQVEQALVVPRSAPASIVPAFEAREPIAVRMRPPLARAVYGPSANHKRGVDRSADTNEPCADTRGLWRARCMRPQILAADQRLRDAYDGAVRAGVDRRMLVAYRNRWSRLRGDAVSDPSYVADTYQRMAQSLEAARAEAVEF